MMSSAAQGIAARSDTTRSGVAEGKSPVPQACANTFNPAADQSSLAPVDSHNHGPDNTSDRTDITGGSFES